MRFVLAGVFCVFLSWGALAADPKPIVVAVGEEFEVVLDSPSGADRQWLLSKPLDESLLKQAGRQYRNQPVSNAPARRCEALRYKAVAKGKAELHLKFASLFEKDQSSVRKTNFVVVITQAGVGSAK